MLWRQRRQANGTESDRKVLFYKVVTVGLSEQDGREEVRTWLRGKHPGQERKGQGPGAGGAGELGDLYEVSSLSGRQRGCRREAVEKRSEAAREGLWAWASWEPGETGRAVTGQEQAQKLEVCGNRDSCETG